MIAEIGLFLLIIAGVVSLVQAAYLLPHAPLRSVLSPIQPIAAWLQALCISLSLASLITLRLQSDFSVANVIEHSNLQLPTLYKITGTWGNHEGSMLLWVWVLAMFGALVAGRIGNAHRNLRDLTLSLQSAVCLGFVAFILFTSNPFARRFPPTTDGQALNPLLQDVGLAIHPPMLYVGYVGFSIVFSFAVAALLLRRADREWATLVHPWILASWSALTLGIGLGSWWAYRELGWGGWWFWDPVENASLLPWLSGTALLHSNLVLKKRGVMAPWVLLLSILTFGLSLLGTFLVRSGALTSVHSFASDPARGVFILLYMLVVIGGGLLVYALRSGQLPSTGQTVLPASREGMIVINNLFLLTACAAVLLGTLYPLFAEWLSGHQLTVGPPFFNATFIPLVTVPLFFAALTPFMAWKSSSLRAGLRAARPALLAMLAAGLLSFAFIDYVTLAASAGFALAAWLATASLQWLMSTRQRSVRLSVFLGHAGAAIMVVGITASSVGKIEVERFVSAGDKLQLGAYELHFTGTQDIQHPNYHAIRATLEVYKEGEQVTTLTPEYRTYAIRGANTSETSILYTPLGDLYSVIGERSTKGQTALRLYYKPLLSWIWVGFLFMTFGGLVAMLQRNTKKHTHSGNTDAPL
jgi:cytochrome c-type biogenesis protein CcmF